MLRNMAAATLAAAALTGCFHAEATVPEKTKCDILLEEIEVKTQLRDAATPGSALKYNLQQLLDALVYSAIGEGCSTMP
jgi:hypothetical protein